MMTIPEEKWGTTRSLICHRSSFVKLAEVMARYKENWQRFTDLGEISVQPHAMIFTWNQEPSSKKHK